MYKKVRKPTQTMSMSVDFIQGHFRRVLYPVPCLP